MIGCNVADVTVSSYRLSCSLSAATVYHAHRLKVFIIIDRQYHIMLVSHLEPDMRRRQIEVYGMRCRRYGEHIRPIIVIPLSHQFRQLLAQLNCNPGEKVRQHKQLLLQTIGIIDCVIRIRHNRLPYILYTLSSILHTYSILYPHLYSILHTPYSIGILYSILYQYSILYILNLYTQQGEMGSEYSYTSPGLCHLIFYCGSKG